MTAEDYASLFAGFFLWQVPLFMISLWGLWRAISRRDHLQRVANLAIWGFGLLITYSLVSSVLRVLLLGIRSNQFIEGGSEAAMSITHLNLWGLAAYPLFIGGFILLARAVFLDRGRGRNGDVQSDAFAGVG